MKLVQMNWKPTDRQLRQFGIICLFALPFVGWLWGAGPQLVSWLAVTGIAVAVAGLSWPQVLKPIFLGLTLVALPIGAIVGELAMLLIYFGVFFPTGLIFRILRRDKLQLKLDRTAPTYWQSKKQPRGAVSYYHQS